MKVKQSVLIIIILIIIVAILFWRASNKPLEGFLPLVGGKLSGSLKMPKSHNLILMDPPEEDINLINKGYVDNALEGLNFVPPTTPAQQKLNSLPLVGGTMKGTIHSSQTTLLQSDPVTSKDALNKAYADKALDSLTIDLGSYEEKYPLKGGVVKGNLNANVVVTKPPTTNEQVATKAYVDNISKDILSNISNIELPVNSLTLEGGTMKGDIKVSKLYLEDEPTLALSLTNKDYVDNLTDTLKVIKEPLTKANDKFLQIKGGTLSGPLITPSLNIEKIETVDDVVNLKYLSDNELQLTEYLQTKLPSVNNDALNLYAKGKYLPLTGGTISGTLTLPLVNVNQPTNDQDLTTKAYVDSNNVDEAIQAFMANNNLNTNLKLEGGTLSGPLTLQELYVRSFPTEPTGIVNKAYLDSVLEEPLPYLPLTGGQLEGSLTATAIVASNPVKGENLATKAYVDNLKVDASALPLAGGTLTGNLNVDTISLQTNPANLNQAINTNYFLNINNKAFAKYFSYKTTTIDDVGPLRRHLPNILWEKIIVSGNSSENIINPDLPTITCDEPKCYPWPETDIKYYTYITTGNLTTNWKIFFVGKFGVDSNIWINPAEDRKLVKTFKANVYDSMEIIMTIKPKSKLPIPFLVMPAICKDVHCPEGGGKYAYYGYNAETSEDQVFYPALMTILQL